jgi:hypothetical protein
VWYQLALNWLFQHTPCTHEILVWTNTCHLHVMNPFALSAFSASHVWIYYSANTRLRLDQGPKKEGLGHIDILNTRLRFCRVAYCREQDYHFKEESGLISGFNLYDIGSSLIFRGPIKRENNKIESMYEYEAILNDVLREKQRVG